MKLVSQSFPMVTFDNEESLCVCVHIASAKTKVLKR